MSLLLLYAFIIEIIFIEREKDRRYVDFSDRPLPPPLLGPLCAGDDPSLFIRANLGSSTRPAFPLRSFRDQFLISQRSRRDTSNIPTCSSFFMHRSI